MAQEVRFNPWLNVPARTSRNSFSNKLCVVRAAASLTACLKPSTVIGVPGITLCDGTADIASGLSSRLWPRLPLKCVHTMQASQIPWHAYANFHRYVFTVLIRRKQCLITRAQGRAQIQTPVRRLLSKPGLRPLTRIICLVQTSPRKPDV